MSFHQTYVLPVLHSVRAIFLGLVIGLLSAWGMVLSYPNFDALVVRQWVAFPSVAQIKSDAYAKAARARLADLPLDPAIGLEFTAYSDADGLPLQTACSYTLHFALPQTRLWTLTALPEVNTDVAAHSSKTQAHSVSLLSGDLVFDDDGHAEVTVSREAHPGNWLALPTTKRAQKAQSNTLDFVDQTIIWLMAWPAGMKLNSELGSFIGELFRWMIFAWRGTV